MCIKDGVPRMQPTLRRSHLWTDESLAEDENTRYYDLKLLFVHSWVCIRVGYYALLHPLSRSRGGSSHMASRQRSSETQVPLCFITPQNHTSSLLLPPYSRAVCS